MKKSEKMKGRAAVADRKRKYTRYALAAIGVAAILLLAVFLLFNPSVAKDGDTVMVYYTGAFENGTVFDSNLDRDPLVFTLGNATVIQGFQEAVTGMSVNETKTVIIPAAKAYGPRLDSLVLVANRSTFPADIVPEVGKMYTVTRNDGLVARVRITALNESTVTIDENHLLAGENLTFTIRLAGFYRG
jgi:peptidylprolyl isomerase